MSTKDDGFLYLAAARFKEERERLYKSQLAAADACGVSRQIWNKYEQGRAAPGGDVLYAFAAAGADVQYILTGQRSTAAGARERGEKGAESPEKGGDLRPSSGDGDFSKNFLKVASHKALNDRPAFDDVRVEASELEGDNSDAWYSATELAEMQLPGMPRSDRRMRDVVERERWHYREVPSQGGKRGIKREYQPPPEVLRLIEAQKGQSAAPAAYTVAERGLNEAKHVETPAAALPPGVEPLDREVMGDCIQAMLELALESGQRIKPKKLRKAILLAYDEVCLREGKADKAARDFARRIFELITD